MPLGSLVDEIIVQGIRQGASSSLSKALSGALASSVAKVATAGALGGLNYGPQAGALTEAVQRLQGQGYGQPPSSAGPATVEGPTVTAPVKAPPVLPAGALGNVFAGGAGTEKLFGSSGGDTIQPVAQDAQATELEGATVVAPRPQPANFGAGAGTLAGLQNLDGVELEPATVLGVNEGQPQGLEAKDLLLPAAAAGALLTLGGSGGSITPAGEGGFKPQDLLPLAPLLPLIPGLTGDGGGGNQDALERLAGNNMNLANRLGNIATAGFAGDIGGRGLNSINRMVRKAQAAIRQRYSAMGMSGSSAEVADLNAASQAGVDLQFKVGQEMAQTGLNAIAALTGQSASIYAQLLNAQTAKDTALGNALANFAGSLVD